MFISLDSGKISFDACLLYGSIRHVVAALLIDSMELITFSRR